jgi:hypothetical protein
LSNPHSRRYMYMAMVWSPYNMAVCPPKVINPHLALAHLCPSRGWWGMQLIGALLFLITPTWPAPKCILFQFNMKAMRQKKVEIR